ncbi:MAG: DUF1585 domain-containing protein [Myxococcota bacterium]|nr:DUF1585 domain-containing protein [Myxococcota bacterium]
MWPLIALLACKNDTPNSEDTALDTVTIPLEGPRLLRRISLDLLGVLPPIDALDAVEADPSAIQRHAAEWLQDPRLEDRMVHLLNERWHTRIDHSPVIFYEEYNVFADDPANEYPVERAIMEEPLRLISSVVVEDEPWETIVLADWTMANGTLAQIWPITEPSGSGWSRVQWTDGRPAAGVLASTGLWRRYYSTVSNMNRLRAAAISKLLLCEDYTARQITFSELDTTEESLENAIQTNPYCLGCHASLDPIAAALFGFYPLLPENADEVDHYHPEREAMAESTMGVSPAWFGDPLNGLNELGQHIAEDPRFERCTVETWSNLLWRRPVDNDDFAQIEALRQGFADSQHSPHALILALIQTPSYTAAALKPEATDSQIESENTLRLLMPDQYASLLKDLSGFEWTYNGFEQLDNDTYGHRILAGGVDGSYVLEPQITPTVSQILVIQRLSEAAAGWIVENELVDGNARRVFTEIELSTASSDNAFDQQLKRLHWQFFGERATAEWIDGIRELWAVVEEDTDPQEAWQAVLSAILQDPKMMGY